MVERLFDRLLPRSGSHGGAQLSLSTLLEANGFDPEQHEQIRSDLKAGRVGLGQNRLPASTQVEDVRPDDVVDARAGLTPLLREEGLALIAGGAVAVVTLAAGAGSRWTQGAGVVKALHPFAKLGGGHRSFLEVHLAKNRRVASLCGTAIPHVITTSHLTQSAIVSWLGAHARASAGVPVHVSPGRAIGLRTVPDGARSALRVGGDVAPDPGRAGPEGPTEPRSRADSLGPARRRGQRLHRQPAGAVPPPGRALVRSARTCSATACCGGCSPTARPAGADAAQHRHGGCGRRPGAAGAPRAIRGLSDVRGHPAPGGGPRRRPRPRERARPAGRGPRPAARGPGIRALVLQLDDHLDPHRPPARGVRPDPRRPRRRGPRHRGGARPCGAAAHLHHAEGREETLGPRAGRRVSRCPSSRSSGAT